MNSLNYPLITPANAKWAAQFLWNLNIGAIDEKYQKLGIAALVDIPSTRYAYHQQAYGKLAEELSKLSQLLKEEAKSDLNKFLSLIDP